MVCSEALREPYVDYPIATAWLLVSSFRG